MLLQLLGCCKALWRFRGYKPQPVTIRSLRAWLKQFSRNDTRALLLLLARVIYLSEKETEKRLVYLNQEIMNRLAQAGIPPEKIIYVQIDEAGSSSPVMLNMLRDAALLERKGPLFLDSKDVRGLSETTSKLGEGAIIYVDDFSATATQFMRSRDFVSEYVVGNFSEFFLVPCICEEAAEKLRASGVEYKTAHIHTKTERPLHESTEIFPSRMKETLTELCRRIDPKWGLGYRNMATMVVFYRNSPNTVPLVLRGSQAQSPFKGLLPRTTDLTSG